MFLLRLILGFVGLVVLIFSVIAGGTLAYTKWLDSRPAPAAAQAALPSQPDLTGLRYGGHTYWIKRDSTNALAVFTPMLPRDDQQVLGAAAAVAREAFGVTLLTGTASIVGPEISVLSKEGPPYFVLLVKEDTGEVHTIRVRRG